MQDDSVKTGARNLATFRLDRQTCALPIEAVVQVIEMVKITPLPRVSRSIEGVINFHGSVIPVVNLRRHIGLSETGFQLGNHIILVQAGERKVGLIVDEVIDVLTLPVDHVIRPTDILPDGLNDTPLLRGLVQTQDETILLLDLDHLFASQQAHALAQVVEALPELSSLALQESLQKAQAEINGCLPAPVAPQPAKKRGTRRSSAKRKSPPPSPAESQPASGETGETEA
ncbi:MAG: chemotaxis protein CheW [Thermoflexales bacterium]|nr:chemotaxis protein CheW [Thermoflexales bacterium]